MERDGREENLSQIATRWTVVKRAHCAPADAMQRAREELLERYGGAARRYLSRCLGNPEAVAELYQDLALRVLSGSFQNADPQQGRFRQYLKTALCHLIADHRRREQAKERNKPLPEEPLAGPPDPLPLDEEDGRFLESWRSELLARTWARLADVEHTAGSPVFTVLHFRAAHPEMPSHEMARELSAQLGKPLTPQGVRQTLHRARERFGQLLLDEVAQSLDEPSAEAMERELIELNLLEYCRPALEHRRGVG